MRLLLVEDNEELSKLIAIGLASAGLAADVVATVAAANGTLATTRFAALILDLGLPDGDGLTVLRELRGRGDPTPVLILTARGSVEERVRGLSAGADDYLPKPFAIEELVARIHALLRRPGELLATPLCLANLKLDTEARQVFVDERPQVFQSREILLLQLLMRRAGYVVPKKLFEDQLYGRATEIGSNTVEVYIHRLRKHLEEVGARVQVATIRGVGYLIRETGL